MEPHVLSAVLPLISLDQVRTIYNRNGVMYARDATGVRAVIERMIDSSGFLGQAVTIGAPAPGSRIEIDVFSHWVMGRQYIGCD